MELAHKLVSTRRGTLLVALLAALLAGVSIVAYLNRYRASLESQGALVTVLVARESIPKGTSGTVLASKALYTATTMRESQLREGAISDPSSLQGTVATREVFEGAQLTSADFAPAGDSLAADLADRQRVISIPLDGAHGMIGQIEVGNRVDVYAGFNVIPLDRTGRPMNGGQARPMLRLIMSDVPVVDVGEKSIGGSSSTNVSLRVDDEKAAQLAFASDNGKVWLALRPSAGAVESRPGIVTVETMLLGVPPVKVLQSLGGNR
ncbi:MAG TPA: Flp pilus assembly protein CpaB [Gaiellaceae bacterium]|nr:Flp pilus assembly protein CpaB [Gaiellaceae bacterium]